MSRPIAEILRDALELPGEARASLANSLLESLDRKSDPDAEGSWRREIQRRVVQIDAGAVRLTPWDEVQQRLEARIRR